MSEQQRDVLRAIESLAELQRESRKENSEASERVHKKLDVVFEKLDEQTRAWNRTDTAVQVLQNTVELHVQREDIHTVPPCDVSAKRHEETKKSISRLYYWIFAGLTASLCALVQALWGVLRYLLIKEGE